MRTVVGFPFVASVVEGSVGNCGAPITAYQVQAYSYLSGSAVLGETCWPNTTVNPGCVVSGLAPSMYTFKVRAKNTPSGYGDVAVALDVKAIEHAVLADPLAMTTIGRQVGPSDNLPKFLLDVHLASEFLQPWDMSFSPLSAGERSAESNHTKEGTACE
ncbi:MAG: hypothetical protein WCP28_17030 [Actinomycetes bacterium]